MLGNGVCWEGAWAHKLLPSAQPAGEEQVPSRSPALPIPGTLLCSSHKTHGPGPGALLGPQPTCTPGLEPQEPTESSSTPQINKPGTAGQRNNFCCAQQQLHASPRPRQRGRDS